MDRHRFGPRGGRWRSARSRGSLSPGCARTRVACEGGDPWEMPEPTRPSRCLRAKVPRRRQGSAARAAAGGLLLVGGHRQPPTSFAAAVGENVRTACCLHPGAKAVLAPAARVVRLVGTLHGSGGRAPSFNRGAGSNHTSPSSSRTAPRNPRSGDVVTSPGAARHLREIVTYIAADAPILACLQKLDVGSTPVLGWSIGAILDWISFSGPRSPFPRDGPGRA